ncbi:Rne/Rng family ribonuclease [Xanthobacter tagetidis]|uniref:Ribonuclease E n=1 Tax=Xanthobacter tagetidis TaxID=60216 RepID=A0A3L7AM78_9HYPH|nr:ribonuclease E/G [Xanthobacter tagetidis]MBB6307596.1 ribonuclease E [Xanthobacter tagetidis]RLP81164.1 Rne/Rng family ribonuclease [Xanthobacter tagetidis]
MANKMLIDATHPEETRVVVVRGNRVEEFDYESASRKQLRGNIYLAKVTRVEPSLQAAFVEYGGNRHGFLAFSEIHPDYYQIPVADRLALIEEEERAARLAEDEHEMRDRRRERGRSRRAAPDAAVTEEVEEAEIVVDAAPEGEASAPADGVADFAPAEEAVAETAPAVDHAGSMAELVAPAEEAAQTEARIEAAIDSQFGAALPAPAEQAHDDEDEDERLREAAEAESHPAPILPDDEEGARAPHAVEHADAESRAPADDEDDDEEDSDVDQIDEDEEIENLGADDDAMEEVPERAPQRRARSYKIQEVIRRRQVMLVQVVKEERGNKGAALTTYLSLAGRYSVLMPNTARGGGISRKITNAVDRKRLKDVVQDLEVPEGMGIILRTAGANRTKVEIKRDFEYLLRLWETVRELTLNSAAPNLVYEEGSLIKRAIRDLYNKDIDDILVAGEAGYKEAKDFMRMLMPSHAKSVIPYRESQPIFARYGVEQQLDAMFSPVVQLKSGGYIVINPTEALVSIDVNSGRATREHHIEDTALKTNMEAAEEIARQLRLRDLAGLIVIDFIDMEEKRNNRSVERKLKDCLKNDRARIQIGRISHFGLLEMSRQRIRTGVLESSIEVCPHCGGTGHVRSAASVALQLLRALEEQLLRSTTHNLVGRTRTEVALYVLNQKRAHLRELEERFSVTLSISADDSVTGHQPFIIEKGDPAAPAPAAPRLTSVVQPDSILLDEDYGEEEDEDGQEGQEEAAEADGTEAASEERADDGSRRKRRRRRRRRGERDETREAREGDAEGEEDDEDAVSEAEDGEGEDKADERGDEDRAEGAAEGEDENGDRRRRRRGRRGGRRNRREREDGVSEAGEGEAEGEDGAPEARGAEDLASDDHASDDRTDDKPPSERPGDAPDAWTPAPAVTPYAYAPPAADEPAASVSAEPAPAPRFAPPAEAAPAEAASAAEDAGKPRRRSTVREKAPVVLGGGEAVPAAPPESPAAEIPAESVAVTETMVEAAAPAPVEPPAPAAPSGEPQKPRSGWWQRKLFGD